MRPKKNIYIIILRVFLIVMGHKRSRELSLNVKRERNEREREIVSDNRKEIMFLVMSIANRLLQRKH